MVALSSTGDVSRIFAISRASSSESAKVAPATGISLPPSKPK